MLEEVRKYVEVTEEDLKNEVILKRKENIYFLLLNKKANTFNHAFMRTLSDRLDEVEKSEGQCSLVTISLDKKMFSGGLDLKVMLGFEHHHDARYFVLQFISLLGKFVALNVPTIVVSKGPAVAGGCMTCFSHDFIYVLEKGFFCCNQVQIGLPLPPGMHEVIKRKHNSHQSLRDMALFGKKFSEKEALSLGLIDGIVPDLGPVIKKANEMSQFSKDRVNFKKLKMEQNKVVIDACYNKQHAVGTVGPVDTMLRPKL